MMTSWFMMSASFHLYQQKTQQESRWWFQIFFKFSPKKLGKISNLTCAYFFRWVAQPATSEHHIITSRTKRTTPVVPEYTGQLPATLVFDYPTVGELVDKGEVVGLVGLCGLWQGVDFRIWIFGFLASWTCWTQRMDFVGLGKLPVFLGQVTSQLRAYLPRISSIADSKSDSGCMRTCEANLDMSFQTRQIWRGQGTIFFPTMLLRGFHHSTFFQP